MSNLTLIEGFTQPEEPVYAGTNILSVPYEVAQHFSHLSISGNLHFVEVIDDALHKTDELPNSQLRKWESTKIAWVMSPEDINLDTYPAIQQRVEAFPRFTPCDVGVSSLSYFLWRQRQSCRVKPVGTVINLSDYRKNKV